MMAGLVSTNINQDDPLKNVVGYDPEKVTIDPTTDTVQGQIDTIINKDSPLMQTARTGALQSGQKRGLLNSSMTAQAGEQAVINTALPIAEQDASFYNRENEFNASAGNVALGQTATNQTQAAIELEIAEQRKQLQSEGTEQEKELATQAGEIEAGRATQAGEIESGLISDRTAGELQIQGLKGEQAVELANIEGQYRTLIQANDSASSFFAQTSASISEILSQPDITADNKNTLVAKEIELLENGLAVIGGISNIDLNALLTY